MASSSGLAPGAAPFVPGGGARSAPPAAAGFKVTAAPFVPSLEAPLTAAPSYASTEAGQLDLRAQPFVPASARTVAMPAPKPQAEVSTQASVAVMRGKPGGQQVQQHSGSSPMVSPPKAITVAMAPPAAGASSVSGVSVVSPPSQQQGGRGSRGGSGAGKGAQPGDHTLPGRSGQGGSRATGRSTGAASASAAAAAAPAACMGPDGVDDSVGLGGQAAAAAISFTSVGRSAGGAPPLGSNAPAQAAGALSPSTMSPAAMGALAWPGPGRLAATGLAPQRAILSQHGAGAGPGKLAPGLQHHYYGPTVPHLHHPHQHAHAPGRAPLVARHFADEKLRRQLAAASYATVAQWNSSQLMEELVASGASVLHIPDRLSMYHSLLPLDHPSALLQPGSSPSATDSYSLALGLRTHILKAVSSVDGMAYALRRLDPKQVMPTVDALAGATRAAEVWAPLSSHPHLVGFRSALISADMDATSALFFVYDFHPGSITLAAAHLVPSLGPGGVVAVQPPSEPLLWSYLVQLACVLRSVHAHRLAIRPACLHPSKVLVSPLGRLRINCCGLPDTLAGDALLEHEDVGHAQRLDLTALGQLMLSLACAGLVPLGQVGSLDLLTGTNRVSPELCRLISSLLASADGGVLGSVRQLCHHPAMVDHMMSELDTTASAQDVLMNDLAKECENGRLFRLLVKLGFVVERPHGDVDESWAETGDRYLLKLFRDFVFHQRVPEGSPGAGGPLLDWGYVIEALNKLDAGVPERIMLLARDEAAMLITSYADLKRCVEASYAELHQRKVHAAL